MYMTVGLWSVVWLVVFGAIGAAGWMARRRRPAAGDDVEVRRRDRAA
jgi:uncharacterized membrane protein